MIDGSVIKVHQDALRCALDASEEAIGLSVGGLSTKLHAKVDAFGLPVKLLLTQGQTHDSQVAHEMYGNEPCEYLLADKAYDIDSLRDVLVRDNVIAVIPSKSNRLFPQQHDVHIYKERNVVERFFQKIKRFRRLSTRYDKTARMFLTNVLVASMILTLKL